MRVRQLVGLYAGEIIDLPYAAATACLAAGTAAPVSDTEAAGGNGEEKSKTQMKARAAPAAMRHRA